MYLTTAVCWFSTPPWVNKCTAEKRAGVHDCQMICRQVYNKHGNLISPNICLFCLLFSSRRPKTDPLPLFCFSYTSAVPGLVVFAKVWRFMGVNWVWRRVFFLHDLTEVFDWRKCWVLFPVQESILLEFASHVSNLWDTLTFSFFFFLQDVHHSPGCSDFESYRAGATFTTVTDL